jgi:multidrug efflux pump subunit AcrB
MMLFSEWRASRAALLVSCAMASTTIPSCTSSQDGAVQDSAAKQSVVEERTAEANVVPSKDRLFAPDQTLCYVNLYPAAPEITTQHDLSRFANILKNLLGSKNGAGIVRNLDEPVSVLRIQLDPDRLQAFDLSTEDIIQELKPSGVIYRDDWHEEAFRNLLEPAENELICTRWHSNPEQFGEIVIRSNSNGESIRLQDVGRVELVAVPFDISSDIDGRPAATLILKQVPGSDTAKAIEDVKESIHELAKESAPGLDFEVIPFQNPNLLYAVIETPAGSTREFTTGKCHELGAIAKGIDEITSVTSLAGYQIQTERGAANIATCLIQWKAPADRKLTSRQIIEKLEAKCRTMDVRVEFFEQPAVTTFSAGGGFSVRVLDKANPNSEAVLDELLNRPSLASLFDFLTNHYRPWELIIDGDVAMQKGVSVANALEKLSQGAEGAVEAEAKFRNLVEELSQSSVTSDRGEMVPYRLFMQLKNKLGVTD